VPKNHWARETTSHALLHQVWTNRAFGPCDCYLYAACSGWLHRSLPQRFETANGIQI